MADRWALLIAIDEYLDPALGAVPYAEASARLAAESLAAAKCPKKNQFVLLGSHATKAAIESRARKLKRLVKKGDSVLVWIDAHGFRHKGAGVLAAWDTLPDDLIDTGVAVADLVKTVAGSKATEVVFLLDVGLGPKPSAAQPPAAEPHLDFDELRELFDSSANAVCLTATGESEESQMAAAVKGSVWTHLVLEAIAGRGAKALTPDGTVTALSLQRHVEDELPRLLRKHFDGRVTQTPHLFGGQNASAVVADLSDLLGVRDGGGLLDAKRLKRVAFRSDSSGRVKDLSGFRKTFRLPDHAGPSSRKFVAKCAAADLRADLDAVFETAREHLGYKRKDMDTSTSSDGFGSLRTPDFEYTVTMTLDAADPTQVVWRREVGQFADVGFVRGSGFEAVFGRTFDRLAFEFAAPVDVGELVDRLEDAPPDGVRVSVESDGSACEVTLAGFAGSVRVERSSLTVRGRSGDSAGLLDQFLSFVGKVGPLGEPLALPAKG